MPRAGDLGFGSREQHTTRATPAATNASAQGGVRPVWLQGSSVTYAQAPRACAPAARSARISACGSPARCMPTLAHHAPGIGQHASDPRIRIGGVQTARSQLQRPQHMHPVLR